MHVRLLNYEYQIKCSIWLPTFMPWPYTDPVTMCCTVLWQTASTLLLVGTSKNPLKCDIWDLKTMEFNKLVPVLCLACYIHAADGAAATADSSYSAMICWQVMQSSWKFWPCQLHKTGAAYTPGSLGCLPVLPDPGTNSARVTGQLGSTTLGSTPHSCSCTCLCVSLCW